MRAPYRLLLVLTALLAVPLSAEVAPADSEVDRPTAKSGGAGTTGTRAKAPASESAAPTDGPAAATEPGVHSSPEPAKKQDGKERPAGRAAPEVGAVPAGGKRPTTKGKAKAPASAADPQSETSADSEGVPSDEAADEEGTPEERVEPAGDLEQLDQPEEVTEGAAEEPAEADEDARTPARAPTSTGGGSAGGSATPQAQPAALSPEAERRLVSVAEEKAAERRESEITTLLKELNEQARDKKAPLGEDFVFRLVRLRRVVGFDVLALRRALARAREDLDGAKTTRRTLRRVRAREIASVRAGETLVLDARDMVRRYRTDALGLEKSSEESYAKRVAALGRAKQFTKELALGERLRKLVSAVPEDRLAAEADMDTVRSALASVGADLEDRCRLNGELKRAIAEVAALAFENGVLASDLSDELETAIRSAETRALLYRPERTLSRGTFVHAGEAVVAVVRGLPRWLAEAPARATQVLLGPAGERTVGSVLGTHVPILLLWVVALGVFRYLGRGVDEREALLSEIRQLDSPSKIPFVVMHLWRLGRWVGIAAALYGTVRMLHFGPASQAFAQLALSGWVLAALLCRLVRVLIAPTRAAFRVLPLSDATARRLHTAVRAFAFVVVVTGAVLSTLETGNYVPGDVLALLRLAAWLVGLGIIAWALYGGEGLLCALTEPARGWRSDAWGFVTVLAHAFVVSAAAVLVVHTAGYWNLSRYLARCIPLSGLAVFAVWVLFRFLNARAELLLGKLAASSQTGAGGRARRDALGQLVTIGVWLGTAGVGALLMAEVWGVRGRHVRRAITALQHPLVSVKGAAVSPWTMLKAAALVLAVLWVATFVRRLLQSSTRLERRHTEGGRYAIATLSFYSILGGGFLWSLMAAGFDLSVLAVFAGMAGIGLGFGLQDIVTNFISGVILLIERPIAINDFIEVGALQGTVTAISLRSTTVRTLDNVFVVVPNSQFISEQVTNLSHRDRKIRVNIPVGVHYRSDMERVYEVLQRCAEEHPEVLRTPAPNVWMHEFGDSSVNFILLVWIAQPHRMPEVSAQLMRSVWHALKEHDIEIPYPQRDLHLRSVDPEVAGQLVERAHRRPGCEPA